jgi:hypothetical protein
MRDDYASVGAGMDVDKSGTREHLCAALSKEE